MWECPDFFRLNGEDVLLMSPQGVKKMVIKYRNLNQTGYLLGQLDDNNGVFHRGEFFEIDNGHDFYATQTLLTPDGRRVMIAWMNAWDSPMYEKEDGWAGALTLPRELVIRDGRLCQLPIKELKTLREKILFDGKLEKDVPYTLEDSSEIIIDAQHINSGQFLSLFDGSNSFKNIR